MRRQKSSTKPRATLTQIKKTEGTLTQQYCSQVRRYSYRSPQSDTRTRRSRVTKAVQGNKSKGGSIRLALLLAIRRLVYISKSNTLIQAKYVQKLQQLPRPPTTLLNTVDNSMPSLRFQYIPHHVLGSSVYQYALDTATSFQSYSLKIGRDIRYKYTKKCNCLKYAAVNKVVLNKEEKAYYKKC